MQSVSSATSPAVCSGGAYLRSVAAQVEEVEEAPLSSEEGAKEGKRRTRKETSPTKSQATVAKKEHRGAEEAAVLFPPPLPSKDFHSPSLRSFTSCAHEVCLVLPACAHTLPHFQPCCLPASLVQESLRTSSCALLLLINTCAVRCSFLKNYRCEPGKIWQYEVNQLGP